MKQKNLLQEEQIISFQSCGAPYAQRVKHWPVDLAAPSSSTARGGIFTTVNGVLFAQPFIINSHRPDMTEILNIGRKIASHPSILSELTPTENETK